MYTNIARQFFITSYIYITQVNSFSYESSLNLTKCWMHKAKTVCGLYDLYALSSILITGHTELIQKTTTKTHLRTCCPDLINIFCRRLDCTMIIHKHNGRQEGEKQHNYNNTGKQSVVQQIDSIVLVPVKQRKKKKENVQMQKVENSCFH